MVIVLVTDLWRYRELLGQLVGREIKARYKQSILGYFWVILNPFFQLMVMTFVFSTVMRISIPGVPYLLFLYVGLLPWTFFTNSLSSATNSLVDSRSLITKIKFPREILPLASILAKIVDLGMASLVLLPFFVFYHRPVSLYALWFIPILIIQLILTAGLGLILSALNLFYRDIQYLISLVLMLWMYLTPIIYPVEFVPDRFRFIFKVNPMSVLVNAYRQAILAGSSPRVENLLIALIVSLITFGVGLIVFKRLERSFADIV